MQAASASTSSVKQFPITLILGGARSGKSRYAQALAAGAGRALFIATATAVDEEMRQKIARHQADRVRDGLAAWTVVEEPLELASIIATQAAGHDLILIDCLTLYAASLLSLKENERMQNIQEFSRWLTAPPCPVVVVSNEVGSGVVPEYVSGRYYRDLLGELNQRVAALATDVALMVAGLPLWLKRGGQPA